MQKGENLPLIVQPGLSRTETALVLHMTSPLPLRAVFKVWTWPLAAHHALSAAERFDTTTVCNQFKDALVTHTHMDYLIHPDESQSAMFSGG